VLLVLDCAPPLIWNLKPFVTHLVTHAANAQLLAQLDEQNRGDSW